MSVAHPKDLPELLEEAAERGFTSSFQIKAKELYSRESEKVYGMGKIEVVEIIQKDQQSTDPGDEATLYLLEASDGEKGTLIIANPMSLSPEERGLLEKLNEGGR